MHHCARSYQHKIDTTAKWAGKGTLEHHAHSMPQKPPTPCNLRPKCGVGGICTLHTSISHKAERVVKSETQTLQLTSNRRRNCVHKALLYEYSEPLAGRRNVVVRSCSAQPHLPHNTSSPHSRQSLSPTATGHVLNSERRVVQPYCHDRFPTEV